MTLRTLPRIQVLILRAIVLSRNVEKVTLCKKSFLTCFTKETDKKIELVIYCKVARHDINLGYHLRKEKKSCAFVCRQTGRQTDRQTDRQGDRQTDRQTDRATDRQTDRQGDWKVDN